MEATAEVLGSWMGTLRIEEGGAGVGVPVDPARCLALETALRAMPPGITRGQVYLRVGDLTGDRATGLIVYLGLPAGAQPASHPQHRAGTLGLYGLPPAGDGARADAGGGGLGFSLDVTAVFRRLALAGPPAPAAIRVDLVPFRPLPATVQLACGRLSFVRRVES